MDPTQPFHDPWPMEESLDASTVVEVDAYHGTPTLRLGCTQLPGPVSRQQKIVKAWCEFFQSPASVRQLQLVSRLPIHLFEAVCQQPQLEALFIKWGPIKDLTPIANLKKIQRLHLGSCSITDLSPIASLTKLEHLFLGNLKHLSDYSPLGELTRLQYLHIEGDPWAPKKVWIDDLKFLPKLTELHGLSINTARFHDESYIDSILELDWLEYLDLDLPKRGGDALRERLVTGLPNLRHGNVVSPPVV